jgi:hypothetical protein
MVAMNTQIAKEDVCLWIDGIGGYSLCSADVFRFGSASSVVVDAAVFADIPAQAFTIKTVEEASVLHPECNIAINGREVLRPTILRNGDRIEVMHNVALQFKRPNPFSRTSVLTLLSRHRWHHHVDGVILLSHCCLIGNTTQSHIFNPNSDVEWMLTSENNQWAVSSKRQGLVNQSSHRANKQLLTPMRRFKGEGIQMTLAIESRQV